MSTARASLTLPSPDATARFAQALGARLHPGDTLLLSGGLGAGKTHFARALIQSLQDNPEDVPSPTYTLVQTYPTTHGELWHADLYRLSDISEIEELGLTEAFECAICLVEWPERLGPLSPANALGITLTVTGDTTRRADLGWAGDSWAGRLAGLLP